jgi:hypothetical protein
LKLKNMASLLVGVLLFAVLATAAFAQETTGNIRGTVKDPNGAVVPNATVTATKEVLQQPLMNRVHTSFCISPLVSTLFQPPLQASVKSSAKKFRSSSAGPCKSTWIWQWWARRQT